MSTSATAPTTATAPPASPALPASCTPDHTIPDAKTKNKTKRMMAEPTFAQIMKTLTGTPPDETTVKLNFGNKPKNGNGKGKCTGQYSDARAKTAAGGGQFKKVDTL